MLVLPFHKIRAILKSMRWLLLAIFCCLPKLHAENTWRREVFLDNTTKSLVFADVCFSPNYDSTVPVLFVPDLKPPPAGYRFFINSLADSGFFVISLAAAPDDGEAPEFFDALKMDAFWKKKRREAAAAFAWIDSQSQTSAAYFGRLDKTRVGVIGHGFGGYIAALLGGMHHRIGIFSAFNDVNPRVGAVVLIGTPTDLLMSPKKSSFSGCRIPILSFYGTADFTGGFKISEVNMRGAFEGNAGKSYFAMLPGGDGQDYFLSSSPRAVIVSSITSAFLFSFLANDSGWRATLSNITGSSLLYFHFKP